METKDKQIEDMAKALTAYEKKLCDRLPKDKCLLTSAIHAQVSCDYCKISEFLVNAGYRKASEVAREIFEEIEKRLDGITIVMGRLDSLRTYHKTLDKVMANVAELKKKYTGEDTNVLTKETEGEG